MTVDYKGKADLLRAFFYSDGDPTWWSRRPTAAICATTTPAGWSSIPRSRSPNRSRGATTSGSAAPCTTDLVPGFLVFTARADIDAARLALGSLVKRPPAPAFLPTNPRLANAAKRIEEAKAAVKSAEALKAGGKPVTKDFTATGELPAVELQTGDTLCGGLVSVMPDYAFDWSGDAKALNLLVEANVDTTLLVRTPDGSFLCADDADSSNNLNPLLAIAKPAAGRYLVWVGRVDPSKPVTGKLTLTEAAGAKPKALKKQ